MIHLQCRKRPVRRDLCRQITMAVRINALTMVPKQTQGELARPHGFQVQESIEDALHGVLRLVY
ncbi:hypothetical protein D3C86_1182580 [compost metagenome]